MSISCSSGRGPFSVFTSMSASSLRTPYEKAAARVGELTGAREKAPELLKEAKRKLEVPIGEPKPRVPAGASLSDLEAELGKAETALKLPTELGGRDGPEPVRYGDWEKAGRCIDF